MMNTQIQAFRTGPGFVKVLRHLESKRNFETEILPDNLYKKIFSLLQHFASPGCI